MQVKKIDAGVFGSEHAGKAMGGYGLAANDPRLPREIPGYVFRQELLRGLSFTWARELNRKPHQAKMGLLLTGPKGSGKTTLVEQFFHRLGVPVFHYTANRATEISNLLESRTLVDGSIVPVEGPLLLAMRAGCPFVLNEVDLVDPGVLAGLNDIVERGIAATSTGVVLAERGFLFVATANGIGDDHGGYAGTLEMNQAFISRFGVKLRVEYPTPAEETQIVVSATGCPVPLATKAVDAARLCRNAEALAGSVSTREVIAWVELMLAFGASGDPRVPIQAMDLAVGNGTDPASREALRQAVQRVFGGVTAPT